jgi:integrase
VERHPKWSPKTIKETRYALRRFILPTLGSTRLDEVTPSQIEDLYAAWTREGYADSGMRRWHGIIRSIFKEAERLGQLQVDPMRRVQPAGGSAPERMHIPEPGDVRRAIDNAKTAATALFFELAAGTGARRGTLIALRWRDLDLEAGTVTFRHAISVGTDGPVLKGTKTNRPYAVHLPQPAVEALKAHHVRALETALSLGVSGDSGNLFVFSRNGGQDAWSIEYPSHAWRVACARAGVVGCRLHDLRHFHATHLLARGVTYRVVAERLGCTESNVLKTYSHWVLTPEDARAAEVITAAMSR